MNAGIIIRHCDAELEQVFESAAKLGFHHGQLVSWDPTLWTEAQAERIPPLCQKYGIELTAFWCGWEGPKFWNFTEGPETLGIVPVAYRARRVQNLLDGAAFARRLEIGRAHV